MNPKSLKCSVLAIAISLALAPLAVYAQGPGGVDGTATTHATTSKEAAASHAPRATRPAKTSDTATGTQVQQTTGTDQSSQKKATQAVNLSQVVVTGNAGASPVTQLTASYAITSLDIGRLHDLNPPNIASVLKTVPGIWVEASGGSDGNNVFVRGLPANSDSPFVMAEIDGSPVYPLGNVGWTSTLDFFRLDDSIERVEVLRGGPSTLFGTGNPGSVINFVTKDGTQTPDGAGSVRATVGPHDFDRIDVFWGGEIAPNWYATAGGFARQGDGVHRTQYPANSGGQYEASLTRTLGDDGSKISFRVRHTRDKGIFIADAPLQIVNGDLRPLPGFDLRKDVVNGNETRMVFLPRANGPAQQADLALGRGINLTDYRLNLKLHLPNDWTFSNNANFDGGSIPIVGLFNGSVLPQTMSSFVADAIASANADPALVAAAGGPATSGTATYVHGGGAVDPNQSVIEENFLTNMERVRSFTDEMRLSRTFDNDNTLTVGAFFATYGYTQAENSGNNLLMTLQNNARLIHVTLDNGVAVSSPEGFASAMAGTQQYANWSGRNVAFYISDTQTIGAWTLQAGIREQHQKISGYIVPWVQPVDVDNNILTLYDNNARVTQLDQPKTKNAYTLSKPAWTIGANRKLSDHMAVFIRASTGYSFPGFGTLSYTTAGGSLIEKVRQYTAGFKAQSRLYTVLLTGFYNKVDNQGFSENIELGNGQFEQISLSGASHAHGMGLDGILHPTDNLSLRLGMTWVDGHYLDFGDNTGNRIQRQPKLQYRFTPEYLVPTNWGALRFFATYTHIGSRYQSITNIQTLPPYYEIDFGAEALVGDHWDLRFNATNATNQIGLTEGNGRSLTEHTNGVFYGRSIYGRTWQLSAKYSF